MEVKAEIYQMLSEKLSGICHESPADIEEEAVSYKVTSHETVCKNLLIVMILFCKIYFVLFIFVVYANHENIFTAKISRSMVWCSR